MNKQETIQLGVPAAVALDDEPPTPAVMVAFVSALLGTALAVSGVFMLFGIGWALVASALPPLLISAFMFRGLRHA